MWSSSGPPGANATPDIGLKVVHEAEIVDFDIVFVHGFNGHRERTWTYKCDESSVNPDREGLNNRRLLLGQVTSYQRDRTRKTPPRKEVFWPRDLLPSTIPNARVIVFGYDTKVHHVLKRPKSESTVYDHARALLMDLSVVRSTPDHVSRPVIFIAHSLGGIVVKEALRQSKSMQRNTANRHLHTIFRSTIGVVFFGTPHAGADPRDWLAHVAEKAMRTAGFTANQQVVDTLLPGSDRLQELRDEFPMIIEERNLWIMSFRETVGMSMFGGKKVVERESACLGLPTREVVWDLNGDHRQICRFSSLEDPQYRKVAEALCRVIKSPPEGVSYSAADLAQNDTHGGPSEPSPTTHSGHEANLSTEQRKELKNLLKFDQIHARMLSLRAAHKQTCGWIIRSGPFRKWIETNRHNGILWIKGKPGAGKSVAMKFLYSEAQKTIGSDILLSFFFNARGNDLEKSTLGLYRSLLFQLLDLEPELLAVLDYEGKLGFDLIKKNGWPETTLKQTLLLALGVLERCRVYCYIDALDECPEDEVRDMIVFFEEIGRPERIRLCFSSRHYPEINVPRALKLILEDEQHHSNDIKVFIDSHLNTPDLPETDILKEQILQKSLGIFLWVALVIPMLNKASDRGFGNRIEKLRRELAKIPSNLHDLFLGILKRDQDNAEELRLCIQWVLFAKRPLTPKELYAAVLIGLEDDPDDVLALRNEPDASEILRKRILDISKGLVETTKSDSPTVQFIHESVRDFLLRGHGVDVLDLSQRNEGRSQNYLAEICRFQLGSFEELGNVPLLEYAQENIIGHANEAQRHGFNQDKFLTDFPTRTWLSRQKKLSYSATLLHILAIKGAECLISIHPKRYSHLRMGDQKLQFPLVAALGKGHTAAASVLLGLSKTETLHFRASLLVLCREARGVSRSSNPLVLLVRGGDALLLRRVFETEEYLTDCRKLYHRDTLLYQAGSEEMVNLLLEFSDALTTQRSPISKQDEINRTADTNARANDGPMSEELRFVSKALQNRPSLLYDDCWGKVCLLGYALEKGFDNLAKLAGLEMSRGGDKENALVIAASSDGNPDIRLTIIKDLYEVGGHLGWVDERGLTLLHHSVQSRSGGTITEFLLSTGKIDIDKKDDLGATALSKAVRACFSDQVKSLVTYGANPNPDISGPSPLHEAVYGSPMTFLLDILSAKKIDLELKDQHGETALYTAVRRQDHRSAKALVEAGADPMSGAFDIRIFPLVSSVLLKYLTMAEVLTSSPKCNRSIRDAQGRNLLWHCVASPFGKPRRDIRLRIMSNLLSSASVDGNHRANPNERDNSGETVLGKAIRLKEVDFVRFLLASGQTDPELKTRNGSVMQTPVEMAMSLSKETDGRFYDNLCEIRDLLVNTRKLVSL